MSWHHACRVSTPQSGAHIQICPAGKPIKLQEWLPPSEITADGQEIFMVADEA